MKGVTKYVQRQILRQSKYHLMLIRGAILILIHKDSIIRSLNNQMDNSAIYQLSTILNYRRKIRFFFN